MNNRFLSLKISNCLQGLAALMIMAVCISGTALPGTNPGLSGQVARQKPLGLIYVANNGEHLGEIFFGQPVPGAEPVLFAPGVFTAELGAHGRLSFSPDGREVFLSSREKIYYAPFDGEKLSPAIIAPFVDSRRHYGPVFSHDGRTLYFTSRRGLPDEKDKPNGRIWEVERSAAGWGRPVLLNEKIDHVTAQISLTDSGRLYFTRLVDGKRTCFCSKLLDHRLADPEPVRIAGNDGVQLMDLYIDPQERFLIGSIARSDRESFRMADLAMSFKQDDGAWGEFRLLNDKVNTDHFERFPGLSPDGRFLFFARSSEAGSFKGARYYWVATETLGIPEFPPSTSGSGERTIAAGLFFGQAPPRLEPVKFWPEVLTSEKHPHGQLAFSPDGKAVFWSAMLQDGPEQTIFFSVFDGKTLSRPEVAPFAAASGNGGPAFSADGKGLFFSAELAPEGDSSAKRTAICYVERTGAEWTKPVPIASTIDTRMTKGQVSVARNGNIYFSGRVLTERTPGIYLCRYSDGKYLPPEKIAGPLTSAALLLDPWIDPEERFMLFSCSPEEGPPMLTDIGLSYRRADGTWSKPVRLGGPVNTPAYERFPSLSPDGKYLFFIRSLSQSFVGDQAHFYWVDAKILDEFLRKESN
jgi:hypothetical protein